MTQSEWSLEERITRGAMLLRQGKEKKKRKRKEKVETVGPTLNIASNVTEKLPFSPFFSL